MSQHPHTCMFCMGHAEIRAEGIDDMTFGCPRCDDGTVDNKEYFFQLTEKPRLTT